MAVSASTLRSRSQDSPTLWLSVLAGSLALHLVLLLAGRWYLSQSASDRAGSPAPLDFVEIDPNAPPLKQPAAPSKSASGNSTSQTSTAPETTTPAQSQEPSIQSLGRQAAPQRSQSQAPGRSEPVASPKPETKPDLRSTSGNFPTNSTQPTRTPAPNSTSSTRPSNPANPGTSNQNSPGSSTGGTNSSGATSPSPSPGVNPTQSPSSGSSNSPNPTSPSGSSSPDSSSPDSSTSPDNSATSGQAEGSGAVSSGIPLGGASSFQGEIIGELERVPATSASATPGRYEAAASVTLVGAPDITLANPINIPVKVLDVKVGLIIDAAGRVLDAKLYDESPTLIEHPELKDTLDGLVDQAFMSSDTLFKVKFEVQNEASQDLLAYRIARVRFRVVQ